jgi:hypothetical protein
LPAGEPYTIREIDNTAQINFVSQQSGECDNTVIANRNHVCRITNTLTTAAQAGAVVLPQSSLTGAQTSQEGVINRQVVSPQAGLAQEPITVGRTCLGGFVCGEWQINVNGLQGILNISSVDEQGKLNGTILGHPIINGTWDQVSKKITFTERITTGLNKQPVLYKYEGFLMGRFCEEPFGIGGSSNLCTFILEGFVAAQRYYTGQQQFGWLAFIHQFR